MANQFQFAQDYLAFKLKVSCPGDTFSSRQTRIVVHLNYRTVPVFNYYFLSKCSLMILVKASYFFSEICKMFFIYVTKKILSKLCFNIFYLLKFLRTNMTTENYIFKVYNLLI